ncbi:bifunctional folylpolyglutamate synthase/dihydrofolate synthase [Metalysinibacillus jejuensis]|uniref:bifunctional folylpolyglutamate synthase/dihydrofolate synthase n=1 Tax=Metalysinibacillus jejuensis TaxID=914327 RepID=UPI000D360909|nr:folylpolyglutamate synthase/dihydrofolate synthase family protein [Metalysinibacillus jejuensis]
MITGFDDYQQRHKVFSKPIIEPGLEAIKTVLAALGNPHHQLRVIHVAGTNGKGTTVAYTSALCRAHQLKTGVFMSPAIVDVHDQIQCDGQAITREAMDEIFIQLKPFSNQLTEFELLTVVALLYFVAQKVDVAIVEAGLGGLEDATNVVLPVVSIITSIALEHTQFLGNTLASIAYHKGGIIKQAPVVVGRVPEEAHVVLRALAQDVPYYQIGEQIFVTAASYKFKTTTLTNLTRQLKGTHQADNMALALTAFLQLGIPLQAERAKQAIANTTLPARFEEIVPNVFFDGAHNEASARELVTTLQTYYPATKVTFVVGILKDKAIADVLRVLEQVSDTFYFVSFANERAATAQDVLQMSRAKVKQETTAIRDTIMAKRDGITVVTGSLYLLAQLREIILCQTDAQ